MLKLKIDMKKIAIILVSFLVFSVSYAVNPKEESLKAASTVMTTSVSGKVVDRITGEALVGVKVSINGNNENVYTDFDGNFEMKNVRPGNVSLTASYISYKNKTEKINIDLSKSNTVNVKIESL